jgi:hypothetical protein
MLPTLRPFGSQENISVALKSKTLNIKKNNEVPARIRHDLAAGMSNTYNVASFTLLYFFLRLSFGKLSHYNDIWRASSHFNDICRASSHFNDIWRACSYFNDIWRAFPIQRHLEGFSHSTTSGGLFPFNDIWRAFPIQ